MFELKIVLVSLLCLPLLVVSIALASKLIDEVLRKSRERLSRK